MFLVYVQLTYESFIMLSVVDFKKKIFFISNWQLKTTFLVLWTKIFFLWKDILLDIKIV